MEHRFRRVAHEAKVSALVHELGDPKRGLTLVFVRTKRGADRLVKRLGAHDVRAVAMHGDKSQSQREKALARFESGHVTTLVATDVAARGIDVAGVTHVINYDAPEAREDYVHRTGRTARAGASGVGITFVLDDQARDVAKLAGELGLEHGLGVEVRAAARHNGGGRPAAAQVLPAARPDAQAPVAAAGAPIIERRSAPWAAPSDVRLRAKRPGPARRPSVPPCRRSAGPAGFGVPAGSPPVCGSPASPIRCFGFGFGSSTRTVRAVLPSRPSGPRAETRTR